MSYRSLRRRHRTHGPELPVDLAPDGSLVGPGPVRRSVALVRRTVQARFERPVRELVPVGERTGLVAPAALLDAAHGHDDSAASGDHHRGVDRAILLRTDQDLTGEEQHLVVAPIDDLEVRHAPRFTHLRDLEISLLHGLGEDHIVHRGRRAPPQAVDMQGPHHGRFRGRDARERVLQHLCHDPPPLRGPRDAAPSSLVPRRVRFCADGRISATRPGVGWRRRHEVRRDDALTRSRSRRRLARSSSASPRPWRAPQRGQAGRGDAGRKSEAACHRPAAPRGGGV